MLGAWTYRRHRALTMTGSLLWGLAVCPVSVPAVEVSPGQDQIAVALERGKAAAAARTPPDRLYAWFGSPEELEQKGFLMTKMAGLTVMSAHFALRGETPTGNDIRQILDERTLLISVTIFGDRPTFAVDSYMLLFQSEKVIKPLKVRFDGNAARTSIWPQRPAYRAKVVASFPYDEIAPRDKTRLSVFPAGGGE